ncbi:MAG TPA: serine/threonine-protein kinase, partial [Rhodothermales bacterium]|nr:serine/threonine-protein kinase [Rhodothermales bacterium]
MEGNLATDPFDITGTRFSHYQVVREIGAGGMGLVYEAVDLRLGRRVALKVLPPWSRFDEDARARFVREAKAASSLNHPNICMVFEYDEVDGRPLISMEFIDGVTLQERNKAGPVPVDAALQIFSQVAAGLEHAHEHNVIHRDIKPGNILLGDDGRVKIADFGLARLSDTTTLTRTGSTLGTVAYMSPEQAGGETVTAKTDVWSLGVVLFEALTGERPFRGEHAAALIYQILNTDPAGLNKLSQDCGKELGELVANSLDKNPSLRPSAADVRSIIAVRAAPSRSTDRRLESHPTGRAKSTKSTYLMASIATAIATILGLAFMVNMSDLSSGATLQTSTLAFVPPTVADSSLQLALRGLVESSVRDISGPVVERGLVGQIAPFADENVWSAIASAEDVHRILGVPFAIATNVSQGASGTTLSFSLVDTERLDTLRTSSVTVNLDQIQSSQRLSTGAIAELLALHDAEPGFGEGLFASISPGAAEFYIRGLGLLQNRSSPSSVLGAIALLERAIEESLDFAAAYAELGRAYLYRFEETKDLDLLAHAERLCNVALEMDPNNQSVHITLGRIHLAKGQFGLASREFDRTLASAPHSAEALLGKARVFNEQGQYEEAEAMYEQAIALRPDYWPGYRELALFYYLQGRYADAVSQFEIVAKLAPLNPLGYRGIGSSYYNLGLLEQARDSWENALEISDDYPTHSNLGTLNFFLGDFSGAATALEKALSLDSTDYIAWSNLAMAYHHLPNQTSSFEKAAHNTIDLVRKLLDLNPKDDFARARLAG